MSSETLDDLMSPVAACLDTRSLEALVELRAEPAAVARMEELAQKANEGLLTEGEQSEYESCVMFANFLGILQSKALKKLKAA
jgi:hypothetical protein